MITRLCIRNFKRFTEVDIPLGSPVVFVGPNNSGKTTALQALALWEMGLKTWREKRSEKHKAKERVGVRINRHDLVQLPVPQTSLLWRDQHLRQAPNGSGKATQNILIEITVEGVSNGVVWQCPLEFDYANDEFIHCRPSRSSPGGDDRIPIPPEAMDVRVAYLPPMSGLVSNERRIDDGAIEVSLGEAQTAHVLRNLCWKVWEREKHKPEEGEWGGLVQQMVRLFGSRLNAPEYLMTRGEIQMSYREGNQRADLDLSAAGRGFQQTLLLLAFLRWKPGCVLLIDEPDAHLEILRQAQIYSELTNTARQYGGQLIIATHSEVVLNEAEKDQIVAFVGQPHRVRQTVELRKALDLLGYEEFYKAEITGWVLYLEGSTDLEALRILSEVTGNQRAAQALERPFQRYVFNQPDKARAHFFGLREAFPSLRGIAIFDQGPGVHPNPSPPLEVLQWRRREMENYFCSPVLLRRWAESSFMADDLFGRMELQRRKAAMEKAITDNTIPAALRDSSHEFWHTVKASDNYLRPVFASFFKELGLKTSMNKSDYAQLARHLRPEDVDPEVCTVLDRIAQIARGKET